MKFLCDVHISIKISKGLEQKGFPSEHVNQILNKWNTKDGDIADYADQNDFILITKDSDFRNSYLLSERPKKLVKVSLGNLTNKELLQILEQRLPQLKFLNDHYSIFMVEISNDPYTSVIKK